MPHKLVSVWSLNRREQWVAYDTRTLRFEDTIGNDHKHRIPVPGDARRVVNASFVYHDVPIQLLETPAGREYIALQPKLLGMLKAIINVKELDAAHAALGDVMHEKRVLIQEHAERLERIQGMGFWRRLGWTLGLTELPL